MAPLTDQAIRDIIGHNSTTRYNHDVFPEPRQIVYIVCLLLQEAWEHIVPVYGTPDKDPKASF